MPRKVIKLDFDPEFDFSLLAILSSLKDYRMCFEISNTVKIKFKRQPDLELKDARHNRSEYSYFCYCNSKSGEEMTLIVNKGSNGVLIPEKKSIDYFLLIRNVDSETIDEIISRIKEIENVNGVYKLDPSEIKSAENLLMFEYSEKKSLLKPH
ncbi:MAG: IPExxxVDY family protein [Bacteroidia bacterium]|nr:IPExxxVDY family protein [Bacteroidia bacterium]MCZ2278471.1 IPExxxVDY family protein [Bacteroidia bacterium]